MRQHPLTEEELAAKSEDFQSGYHVGAAEGEARGALRGREEGAADLRLREEKMKANPFTLLDLFIRAAAAEPYAGNEKLAALSKAITDAKPEARRAQIAIEEAAG